AESHILLVAGPWRGSGGRGGQVELAVGDDLQALAGAGPEELGAGVAPPLEVLHADVVLLPRLQADRARVALERVGAPVADDELAVDPQAHAVVGLERERVGLAILRL